MKSRLLGVLFLVFTIICCACVHGGQTKAPDAYDLESETVALVATNKYGAVKIFCAATWIGDNKLLTAAHCAVVWGGAGQDPAYSTEREAGDGEQDIDVTHPLRVIAVDEVTDLAVLYAPRPTPHQSASVARFRPTPGEHVAIMGHPGRVGWSHMEGVVSAFRTQHGFIQDDGTEVFGPVMQVQAPIWGGNSGGGAFNSDGELVGVCSYGRSDIPDMGFFIALGPIQKFVLAHGW